MLLRVDDGSLCLIYGWVSNSTRTICGWRTIWFIFFTPDFSFWVLFVFLVFSLLFGFDLWFLMRLAKIVVESCVIHVAIVNQTWYNDWFRVYRNARSSWLYFFVRVYDLRDLPIDRWLSMCLIEFSWYVLSLWEGFCCAKCFG